MATVAELMTWALMQTPLKAFCGVSGSAEDSNLQLWLGAMAVAADSYLGITDDDDEFTTLPDPVKLAVFLAVQSLRQRHGRPDGLSSSSTSSLSESYRVAFSSDAALAASRSLLRPYKEDLSLDGQ